MVQFIEQPCYIVTCFLINVFEYHAKGITSCHEETKKIGINLIFKTLVIPSRHFTAQILLVLGILRHQHLLRLALEAFRWALCFSTQLCFGSQCGEIQTVSYLSYCNKSPFRLRLQIQQLLSFLQHPVTMLAS